jgi:metacaspase-1
MHPISRRHFLQFAGSTLATLGLSQLNIQQQGERYGKVLAQSTPRKLALLVGINQYASEPLRGCVNDMELQRHLLIHRFGFNPNDIHTLTDEQATRQGILEAFEEHLIKQAKPGDVVVYHYSGHGSRIFDPDPIVVEPGNNGGLNGTFVPVNTASIEEYPEQGGVVEDIMGHTLFLLMLALKSENFTAVLDSCYSGSATREYRVRARDNQGKKLQVSPTEKAYQDQWLSRLKLSREDFVKLYRRGVAKGVVLAATDPNQTAIDLRWNNFYVGAFTYLLTQYLWQQTSTPQKAIAYTIENIPKDFNQTPLVEVKVASGYERQPIYFSDTTRPVADAVVTEVKGNQVKLWLGGVNPAAIKAVKQGTVFTILGVQRGSSGLLTLESRDSLNGLIGIATVEGGVQEGTLLKAEGL